jgi:hypothetical protein
MRGALDSIATFIGPLEVRDAGDGKGRGLFVTRNVQAGELLLVEPAISMSFSSEERVVTAISAGRMNTESQHEVVSDLVRRAVASSRFNSLVALLSTGQAPSPAVPDLSVFVSAGPVKPRALCSALDLKHIVRVNTFAAAYEEEPSKACRRAMQRILTLNLIPPPKGGYKIQLDPLNEIMDAALPSPTTSKHARREAVLAAIRRMPAADRHSASTLYLTASLQSATRCSQRMLALSGPCWTRAHGRM